MQDTITALITNSWDALVATFIGLLLPAVFFTLLGILVKRDAFFADIRKALPEVRTTILLMVVNIIVIVPVIIILSTWISAAFENYNIYIFKTATWDFLPLPIVIFLAIFAGDFIGYWRHRFEHSRWLWPFHAVHHSDTEMVWLSLERFHPVNRITTFIVDSSFLLLLGFPPEAVIINNLVRHYYGFFIHADVPWTFGKFGKIFVSPAMHRWHHSAEVVAFSTNYATVFSLFDWMFGSYRVPGPCNTPLGVADDMGKGALGQLSYPLKPGVFRRTTIASPK